jgi:hypothetical protein
MSRAFVRIKERGQESPLVPTALVVFFLQAAAAAPPPLPPPNLDDLPRTVIRHLHQGATVTTMDFHPFQHSTLLGEDLY